MCRKSLVFQPPRAAARRSAASIFIRFAQTEGVPSIVIAAARLTIASLILAPSALTHYRAELRGLTRREWILGLLSGLFLAFHFASWITSLQYTTVASSVVLVTTTPLWVALLSPLVLREKITPMILIGMLLALIGGGIVAVSDSCTLAGGQLACPPVSEFLGGSAFLGNFLAVYGAWMAAVYILIGRRVRAKMSLIPYIFVVYAIAAVVLIAVMFSGFPRGRVKLADIAAATVTRTTFWEGWGIRLTPRGWLYSVSGHDALLIERRNGKPFLLGTDEPRKLKAALDAALAPPHPRR